MRAWSLIRLAATTVLVLVLVLVLGCGGDARESGPELSVAADRIQADLSARDAASDPASAGSDSRVIVNVLPVDLDFLESLEARFGVRVVDGSYWYDARSGAYGLEGGPSLGFTLPELEWGGPLREDASGGGTSVWVNGRELHPLDVLALQAFLGSVYPGRYWLDAQGWYGVEGGPAAGNLIYLEAQASGGGGGYNRSTYGGHLGSDGTTSFYFDPGTGCSVMSGSGVSC